MLDNIIGWFSPQTAYKRRIYREGLRDLEKIGQRGYQAAHIDRLNRDWRATNGSGDTELIPDLGILRARCRQMVRDNKYASSALKNITTGLVGDGITARATHPDPDVSKKAQDWWDSWADGPVDGRNNFYTIEKMATRGAVESGEALLSWNAFDGKPNARVRVLDADYLPLFLTQELGINASAGNRVIAGVEFDQNNDRAAYHLYTRHPGDMLPGLQFALNRVDAKNVDHVFDPLWGGQVRGVPWFHAGISDLREIDAEEEAIRVKRRVEACLAVLLERSTEEGSDLQIGLSDPKETTLEGLSPGMIARLNPGEKANVVNPSSTGEGDGFRRAQLAAVSASFGVPVHLMTGDPTGMNYTTLRAVQVLWWAQLDEWIGNTILPNICNPAFRRRMATAALMTGDTRFLQVRPVWTPPPRPWVDPLKDITAEILAIRGGLDSLQNALGKRGIDWRERLADQYRLNSLTDLYGVAYDTDPRKVNGVGGLQPPAGFVLAQPGAEKEASNDEMLARAIVHISAMSEAEERGDIEAAQRQLAGAAEALGAVGEGAIAVRLQRYGQRFREAA